MSRALPHAYTALLGPHVMARSRLLEPSSSFTSARRWQRSQQVLGFLRRLGPSLCVALTLLGCGSDGSLPPSLNDTVGVTPRERSDLGLEQGGCEDGETAACGITLSLQNDTVSCYRGRQVCERGQWSECQDGETTLEPVAKQEEPHERDIRALSDPAPCDDNPCDPGCMYFAEDPDDDLGGGTMDAELPEFGDPGAACEHALCDVGSSLDPLCNYCVAQVCEQDPTCCSSSWTAACVELVYLECAGVRRPVGLCEFGLFSEGAIVVADRGSTDAIIGAYGDIVLGTDAAFSGVISTGNITFANLNGIDIDVGNGIFADGSVSFAASNSTVHGDVYAGASVEIKSQLTVQGQVQAGTNIFGETGAQIDGDATANSGITTVAVSGTSTPNAGLTPLPVELPPRDDSSQSIPVLPTDCSGTTDFYADGSSAAANADVAGPGTYRDVQVLNGGSVTLQGQGIYYFNSLDLNGDLILDLDGEALADGWEIRVCGDVELHNSARVMGQGGLPVDGTGVLLDPELLVFYADTSNDIEMGVDVYWTGVFIAPHAMVRKSNMNSPPSTADILSGSRSAPVNGAIWASSIDLGTDAGTFSIDRAVCEGIGIPGTLPSGDCPADNDGVPSPLVEPCQLSADCQHNHSCRDPLTASECAHSKCSEGDALDLLCDPCVHRICQQDPTCCGTSWSASCVSLVGTVCDSICGDASCDHGACEVGGALDPTCGACVEEVCEDIPSCCTGAWTDACVEHMYNVCPVVLPPGEPSGTSVCDYPVLSAGPITLNGALSTVQVSGGAVLGQDPALMVIDSATVSDDVFSEGAIDLDDADVGSLWSASGTTTIDNSLIEGATVTGATFTGSSLQPDVARPTRSFSCSAADGVPASGNIGPGDYGDVVVPDGDTLTLSAGSYTFSSLQIGQGSGAVLEVPAGERVSINVCGAVVFEVGSQMSGPTSTTAMLVDMYAFGDITALGGNVLWGLFNADGAISFQDSTNMIGAIWSGLGIDLLSGSTVTFDGQNDSCISLHDSTTPNRSSPLRLCAYAAYGSDELLFTTGSSGSGADWGGQRLLMLDDVEMDGNLYIEGNAIIGTVAGSGGTWLGNIEVGGTLTNRNFDIQGEVVEGAAPRDPLAFPDPGYVCPTGGAAQTGGDISLAPDTYGDVEVANGGSLTLSAPGKYYVSNFRVLDTSALHLPTSGVVEIIACGQIRFDEDTTLTGVGPTDADRFRLYSASTLGGTSAGAAIWLTSGTTPRDFYGMLIAQDGRIELGDRTTLYGVAWGEDVYVRTGSRIDASGYAGEPCEALELELPGQCPEELTPVDPTESGSCVPNFEGYEDTTCSGYDLSLGIPCAGEVFVCNHGTTSFSGSVDVGYFAEDKNQMSFEQPTVSPDGMCSAALSIAAGTCEALACAVPLGTYSLMVDPEDNLSECDGRRHDNWTVSDGRNCLGAGEDQVVVEDYEAVCPEDSGPRWGLLTWNAETPADSRILFSAGVSATSGELSSADMVLVGQANNGATPAVDTQVCGATHPGGLCPIDLTAELGLGANQQEKFLRLEIEFDTQGFAPVLQDWEITYSCVVDQ